MFPSVTMISQRAIAIIHDVVRIYMIDSIFKLPFHIDGL